jgi:hypothetical protein
MRVLVELLRQIGVAGTAELAADIRIATGWRRLSEGGRNE